MARRLGLVLPAAGMGTGALALALWVSALPLGWLDLLVLVLFLLGLGLSLAGYIVDDSARVRRLAVVAIGWNSLGLAALAIVYATG